MTRCLLLFLVATALLNAAVALPGGASGNLMPDLKGISLESGSPVHRRRRAEDWYKVRAPLLPELTNHVMKMLTLSDEGMKRFEDYARERNIDPYGTTPLGIKNIVEVAELNQDLKEFRTIVDLLLQLLANVKPDVHAAQYAASRALPLDKGGPPHPLPRFSPEDQVSDATMKRLADYLKERKIDPYGTTPLGKENVVEFAELNKDLEDLPTLVYLLGEVIRTHKKPDANAAQNAASRALPLDKKGPPHPLPRVSPEDQDEYGKQLEGCVDSLLVILEGESGFKTIDGIGGNQHQLRGFVRYEQLKRGISEIIKHQHGMTAFAFLNSRLTSKTRCFVHSFFKESC